MPSGVDLVVYEQKQGVVVENYANPLAKESGDDASNPDITEVTVESDAPPEKERDSGIASKLLRDCPISTRRAIGGLIGPIVMCYIAAIAIGLYYNKEVSCELGCKVFRCQSVCGSISGVPPVAKVRSRTLDPKELQPIPPLVM